MLSAAKHPCGARFGTDCFLRINYAKMKPATIRFGLSEVAMMTKITLTAVIHREEDLYVAECPEVGTISQGSTIEKAIQNLKEATELYLEEFPIEDISRSLLTTFEVPLY